MLVKCKSEICEMLFPSDGRLKYCPTCRRLGQTTPKVKVNTLGVLDDNKEKVLTTTLVEPTRQRSLLSSYAYLNTPFFELELALKPKN